MPVGLMPRVRHGHHFLKKGTCCVFQWSGSRRRFLRGFPGNKTLACPIGCVPRSEVREAFLRDALALSKLDLPPETRSFARAAPAVPLAIGQLRAGHRDWRRLFKVG